VRGRRVVGDAREVLVGDARLLQRGAHGRRLQVLHRVQGLLRDRVALCEQPVLGVDLRGVRALALRHRRRHAAHVVLALVLMLVLIFDIRVALLVFVVVVVVVLLVHMVVVVVRVRVDGRRIEVVHGHLEGRLLLGLARQCRRRRTRQPHASGAAGIGPRRLLSVMVVGCSRHSGPRHNVVHAVTLVVVLEVVRIVAVVIVVVLVVLLEVRVVV
jgi:hypothetical protein